jgi:hypothetical protein
LAKKKTREAETLTYPVAYGNVNIGDKTARLGVSISRANLTVNQADKLFCERRVKLRIIARPAHAAAEQPTLPGMPEVDFEISATADTKGYSADGKKIGFGLTFVLSGLDIPTLSHFAKREGMLYIEGISDLPAEEEGKEDEQADAA